MSTKILINKLIIRKKCIIMLSIPFQFYKLQKDCHCLEREWFGFYRCIAHQYEGLSYSLLYLQYIYLSFDNFILVNSYKTFWLLLPQMPLFWLFLDFPIMSPFSSQCYVLKKINLLNPVNAAMNGYECTTIHWSMGNILGATCLKKTDCPSPAGVKYQFLKGGQWAPVILPGLLPF